MELRNKLEALLFASGRKMDLDELSRLTKTKDRTIIKDKLIELKKEYEARESPVIVVEEGEFWKLTTHEKFIQLVRQINSHTELSKTIMETLAVIAWKQPMLQCDVINIRTNKAYDHIKELMEMGFVVKERYGRTYLLKLTQKFFEYFDVRNDDSLKALFREIKEEVIDQKKVEDFNVEKTNVPEDNKTESVEAQSANELLNENSDLGDNEENQDENEQSKETDEKEEIINDKFNIEGNKEILEAEDNENNIKTEGTQEESIETEELKDQEDDETDLEKELNGGDNEDI